MVERFKAIYIPKIYEPIKPLATLDADLDYNSYNKILSWSRYGFDFKVSA
ncbi:21455_t:CDS:1, partial [Rhizophagus irregularis]